MTQRLIERPRLLEQLCARWDRRAVVVTAATGYGKSVLVDQAVSENLLSPRGVDLVVRCTVADRDSSHLSMRIAASAGLPTLPATAKALTPEDLLDTVARALDDEVCIVLDDADQLVDDIEGARLLGRLVTTAPQEVHFVIVTRRRLAGFAMARAADDVIEIGQDALALSIAEERALAQAHDVDAYLPATAGGWPAAAAMAAMYGPDGADEYVLEALRATFGAVEHRALAIAIAVDGGDAELLRAAAGPGAPDPSVPLAQMPLVSRGAGGELVVHDRLRRVYEEHGNPLRDEDGRAVIGRAMAVLVERRDFDRAFRLCASHRAWDLAADVLTACCRRGHAEVMPDVLARWLALLPADRHDLPEGLLLRGLGGRVTDPFGSRTAELLERAVQAYRATGNVAGEVASGVELVYVLRNQGRCEEMVEFLTRAAQLDAAGHPEVVGPAAIGRALLAELSGDDCQVIAELSSIPPGSLSRDWQTVADFRLAITHLTLGNEAEMTASARRCVELAGDSRDRHVGALAEWFAGDPTLALATRDEITADAGCSQVDAVCRALPHRRRPPHLHGGDVWRVRSVDRQGEVHPRVVAARRRHVDGGRLDHRPARAGVNSPATTGAELVTTTGSASARGGRHPSPGGTAAGPPGATSR